jgi:hypothetical protein
VARIADVDKYVSQSTAVSGAPIDSFYESCSEILRPASPVFLSANPSVGALLLVGLVSATENYFRDAIGRLIRICPLAQECCANQVVSLGTVIWYNGDFLGRSAFEQLSFASSDNVRNALRKYLGHDVRRNGPLDSALAEFEKICELRHSIVHAGASLAGRNALRLQVEKGPGSGRVVIGFAELQETAAICTTLVVAANGELFDAVVRRWADSWRKHRSWDGAKENERFREVWSVFWSETDARTSQTAERMGRRRCMNLVRKEFRLP